MKTGVSRLSDLMLEAVSTDHTPFESMIAVVASHLRRDSDDLDTGLAEGALLTLLNNGLVEACLIHAEPPFVTVAQPVRSTLPRFWFRTTRKGEEYLNELSKHGEGERDAGVEASHVDAARCEARRNCGGCPF